MGRGGWGDWGRVAGERWGRGGERTAHRPKQRAVGAKRRRHLAMTPKLGSWWFHDDPVVKGTRYMLRRNVGNGTMS